MSTSSLLISLAALVACTCAAPAVALGWRRRRARHHAALLEREELLQLVAQATSERRRLEEQVLLSERMASLGTIAAGVAHEMSTPLACVVANLEYAREALGRAGEGAAFASEAREELACAVHDAAEGAARVRAILADLKSFSRARPEERGPVDLARVAASALNMARHELKHRARVVQDLGAAPHVLGDEGRLGQVVLNLLVNAAQAIPEGRAGENEIAIRLRAEEDGRVALEVSDTGCGIAPEALPHIFDPFFTTKRDGGTGLGLAICHGIVTALGGEIRVTSHLGHLTTFLVLLPSAPPPSYAAAPPCPRSPRKLREPTYRE